MAKSVKKTKRAATPKRVAAPPTDSDEMLRLLKLAKSSKTMTDREYQKLLDNHDLTQTGIAELLKLGHRTSRRYAAGVATVPQPTAKLLRLFDSGALTLEQIAAA